MNQTEWVIDNIKYFLNILNTPIFELNGSKISSSSMIVSFLIILGSFKIAKMLGKSVNKFLGGRAVDSGIRDSLERFTRYLVVAVGFLFALDTVGFSISSLAALGAVLMVGVGFGLQNIAQNFISGIIILIERPVKVGDIVHVGNAVGRITDIHVRSTIIQTRDDVAIIVPNSKLVSEEVINASFSGNKIRQHIRVGVSYGSNTGKVRELLLAEASAHPKVLKSPQPIVVFEDFGDSSLNFDLRFFCDDIWLVDIICSDLRFQINESFKLNNIQIPFPQRDVHLISNAKI